MHQIAATAAETPQVGVLMLLVSKRRAAVACQVLSCAAAAAGAIKNVWMVLVDEHSNQAQHRCAWDDEVNHKGVRRLVAPAAHTNSRMHSSVVVSWLRLLPQVLGLYDCLE